MATAEILLPPTIGLDHNGLRMTPEEFDAIDEYDDLYSYELIHGVLVVSPFALQEERGPNEELGRLLLNYKYEHNNGPMLDATLVEEYIRTGDSRRRADRVIWAGLGRHPDPRRDAPTIVVEFVSAGRRSWRRDYLEKREEYLALGIAEYWIIDRFQRTMTVFRKTPTGFAEEMLAEQAIYRPTPLPGFELPLARILTIADQWTAAKRA